MKSSLMYGSVTVAVGIFVCLFAYRIVAISADRRKDDAWHAKWGGFMKVSGPLIVAWGVFNLLRQG
jgi:hypothetical protein